MELKGKLKIKDQLKLKQYYDKREQIWIGDNYISNKKQSKSTEWIVGFYNKDKGEVDKVSTRAFTKSEATRIAKNNIKVDTMKV